MKPVIFFMLILAICLDANSQTDSMLRKTTSTSTMRTVTLQQKAGKNLSAKLPDLKFTALNVVATPMSVAGTYTLDISFTVKNEGTASILTDNVTLNGLLSDETWITRGNKDLSMTGFLQPAGGQILSSIPARNEMLEPGASKQVSYALYNKQLAKDPKPIFIITINIGGGVKELDSGNNMTYVTILL